MHAALLLGESTSLRGQRGGAGTPGGAPDRAAAHQAGRCALQLQSREPRKKRHAACGGGARSSPCVVVPRGPSVRRTCATRRPVRSQATRVLGEGGGREEEQGEEEEQEEVGAGAPRNTASAPPQPRPGAVPARPRIGRGADGAREGECKFKMSCMHAWQRGHMPSNALMLCRPPTGGGCPATPLWGTTG
ncbi:unnamed protein product [Prorocentrum cordatum]|uniref:Uncharacterized protein n=1 Tax=Prorocentrum cordatum TaxID=2364126 RepID=A0ABN9T2P0_9DINO|nr:unnamed protein product [Polarella glacialis]